MSEIVTTTQLLEFLVKADKVSSHVTFKKIDGGYEIGVCCPWDDDDDHYTQTTYISEEGCSSYWGNFSDYEFDTMNSALDELVEKAEVEEKRRLKRQELLSRLTDEEKELLGV